MKENFAASLAAVLVHEGGYVFDPADPGGETNRGITKAVYDDWRIAHGIPRQNVRLLSQFETEAIYRKLYWDAIRGDQLPSGVDYCTFDFAVNSGVNRASRYLQRAAGVTDDGQIGPMTLAAVDAKPAGEMIDAVCDGRLAFLKQLPTFDHFGHGWTTRVNDVRAMAKGMVA